MPEDINPLSLSNETLLSITRHPEFPRLVERAKREELLKQLKSLDPEKLTKINFSTIVEDAASGFHDAWADSWSDAWADAFSDSNTKFQTLERLRVLAPEQLSTLNFSTEGRISR